LLVFVLSLDQELSLLNTVVRIKSLLVFVLSLVQELSLINTLVRIKSLLVFVLSLVQELSLQIHNNMLAPSNHGVEFDITLVQEPFLINMSEQYNLGAVSDTFRVQGRYTDLGSYMIIMQVRAQ